MATHLTVQLQLFIHTSVLKDLNVLSQFAFEIEHIKDIEVSESQFLEYR